MLWAEAEPHWITLVTVGVLLFLQQVYQNWKAGKDKKEVTGEVKRVYKVVNGRDESKDENPRGLTGLAEEHSAKLDSLAVRFDAHVAQDDQRHNENLEAGERRDEAMDKLSEAINGKRPR